MNTPQTLGSLEYRYTHQCIWSSAHASTARLYTKQIIEQRADVVVVQEATGGRVAHQEREDGQPLLRVRVTQDGDVGTGRKNSPRTTVTKHTHTLHSHLDIHV